ncbi:MAG: cache domain-containing protein [Huintestinicola sp.]
MARSKMNSRARSFRISLIVLICILSAVVTLNVILIKNTDKERIQADGQMRLSSIAGQVDNSLYQAECLLDSVAMKVEQIIAQGGDTDKLLSDYFSDSTIAEISSQSDGRCFNTYAAYNGKLYIHGFTPGEDFVLQERTWYVDARKLTGSVNVTDPYIDANTGQMCYTLSKALPDGNTVIGLDFNLTGVQRFIEEMDSSSSGTALIVSEKGMIVGHSSPELVGGMYGDYEFYRELVNKVRTLCGDSFDFKSNGDKYTVFSEKTSYDWYLIVCVPSGLFENSISGLSLYIIIFMVILAVALVLFCVYNYRSKAAAEQALSVKEEFLKNMSSDLKRPLSSIINRSEVLGSSEDPGAAAEIGESARELGQMLDELIHISDMNTKASSREKSSDKGKNTDINHKKQITLITAVLILSSAFAVIFNTRTQVDWGDTKMQKETEQYLYQVKEWIDSNRAVLDVIAYSIAAKPGFEEDYDTAVDYLDSLVSHYDNISVAYLCNPEWEHTVLMNNRWEPEADWHVEERQWYIDTLISQDNFSISSPYLDEQTGLYCTTLSTIVYDDKGEFIGVLGIDYYLDKLIGILGASYTDKGYAFLTDINGSILNHPNYDYQMKPESFHNAAELCYRSAFSDDGISFIDDYDGEKKVCLAMTEESSGFTVFVVRDVYEIYGNAVASDMIYISVFVLCIIIVLVIMHNLTEWQERVNSELKEAADKAISAGKSKNDFLANMSHEIRTPINAVLGMNEMILRECSDKQIIEYAENIRSAGRTLLSLINEILDFSKIESGKMEIIPVEYDVSQLIGDLVNMIKTRADKKGLKFITEIDGNIPSVLYGDDVRIRQIITNILTNAVKYTQKGTVRLKMNLLDISEGIAKLEVSVSDTGMGIREEDLAKLFTSFQRLDQERNRNIEGTGLGINIVQSLLKMMGSELNVASVYGVGSTFSFIIQQKVISTAAIGSLNSKIRTAHQHEAEKSIKTAPEARVLIVDDNETNLLVAKSLLKRTLVETDTASGGKECISLLEKKMYDIVFLDHMMPEMDGIETLKIIKERQLALGTAIIALTANAVSGAKQEYMDAGFDDYLSKPISGAALEECLFKYLDHSLIVKEKTASFQPESPAEGAFSSIGTDIDIDKGLSNFNGDADAYMDAVYEFCDNNLSNDLEFDVSTGNMKSLLVNVQRICRDSKDLGLSEIAEKAERLAEAVSGKDEKYVSENHREFIELYRTAADNLDAAADKYFSEGDEKE